MPARDDNKEGGLRVNFLLKLTAAQILFEVSFRQATKIILIRAFFDYGLGRRFNLFCRRFPGFSLLHTQK